MSVATIPTLETKTLPSTTRLSSPILIVTFLAIALAATRWPMAPRFLFDFDNVNFALALRHFAPALSQPHRGYPLYVAVSRIVHWFVPSPEWTALTMGLVGSLLALFLLITLAREMFGPRAAWIAPALLFFNPAFILAGTVNHVRTFLAAGAIATALFVWRGQWKTAAFVLGIAGGFRMELVPTMFPLLFSPLLLQRTTWKRAIAPLAILAATVAPWFLFTAWSSGGIQQTLQSNALMLRTSFGGHSIWYEGFTVASVGMALYAVYWNGVGGLCWFWAVPAAIRNDSQAVDYRKFAFLAIWFIPPFLFNAVVHVTDPDQMLACVAAVCLGGSWALAALRPRWTMFACAIGAALFVFPLTQRGRQASLPWIRHISSIEENVMNTLARTPGPHLVVIRGIFPTWRVISYYFPGDFIQQGGFTAHENTAYQGPLPPGLLSRITVDEQGAITVQPNIVSQ